MTEIIAQGPVDVNVRGEIFVLADPSGRVRSAATTLDSVTRTLIEKEMPTPMWNGIFGNDSPEARAKVYAVFGWRVMVGTFTPNVEVRGDEQGA